MTYEIGKIRRVWLTPDDEYTTGSICWKVDRDAPIIQSFVSLSSCQDTIRIFSSDFSTPNMFIKSLKNLISALEAIIDMSRKCIDMKPAWSKDMQTVKLTVCDKDYPICTRYYYHKSKCWTRYSYYISMKIDRDSDTHLGQSSNACVFKMFEQNASQYADGEKIMVLHNTTYDISRWFEKLQTLIDELSEFSETYERACKGFRAKHPRRKKRGSV